MRAVVNFDGSCGPSNPAEYVGWGVSITINGDTLGVSGASRVVGGTNNLAEYLGAINGMKKALELGVRDIHLRGDSMLIINHLRGVWEAKSPHLIPLLKEAKSLLSQFDSHIVEWVPRRENFEANTLAYNAYKQLLNGGAN